MPPMERDRTTATGKVREGISLWWKYDCGRLRGQLREKFVKEGWGDWVTAGVALLGMSLVLSYSADQNAANPASRVFPSGGGVTLPNPEPTPTPDPWYQRAARPGQAFLEIINEGCVNEKPAITVLSRFMENTPKIGVLGIIEKKPGRSNPFILGVVGVSDSAGKGRDKRFYNGETKPEKQFTDYSVPTVKLSDGRRYEIVVLPGKITIRPTGDLQVRFESLLPLVKQEFRVNSSCLR